MPHLAVLGLESENPRGLGPYVQRLPRQRIHEVDVERVERLGRLLDGRMRLGRVVHAADGPQHPVVEALHAHGQPGHAGRAKGAKALPLESARVGFERDFAARVQRQPGAHVGEQPLDAFGREQARRAAADEHAGDPPPPDPRQRRLEVREREFAVAAEEARAAQDLAEREYARGVATLFELIDAYTRRIDAERGLITARSDRVSNRIAYHVALGGGARTGGIDERREAANE